MKTETKLFVYGTLRSGFHQPAYKYISKHFTFIGEARVKGLLYDMGEYPAAVPTNEDFFIVGELYELNKEGDFEWAIEQLDDYEGLNPAEDELQLYKREVAEIIYNDQPSPAWIYWYNQDVKGRQIISTGNVFDYKNSKSIL